MNQIVLASIFVFSTKAFCLDLKDEVNFKNLTRLKALKATCAVAC
jgi:hypothetical protein